MRRIVVGLALAAMAFAAAAQQDAREAAVAKRIQGWVEAVNAGDPAVYEQFAQQNFARDFLARGTPERRSGFSQSVHERSGTLTAGRIGFLGDEAVLDAKAANGDELRIHFMTEGEPPYLIAGIRIDVGAGGGAPPRANLPPLTLTGRSREQLAKSLDPYLRNLEKSETFSGVALVAKGDDILFEKAYGLAERAFNVPNTTDARFDTGSITKLMTRAAIARLVQDGKLDLDAPLITYLPDYPNKEVASKITIGQIAAHRSGLGDIVSPEFFRSNMTRFRNPADWIELHAKKPLAFEPGTREQYSNYGYAVLSYVIERVSGMSYYDYVKRVVFDPAGMTSAGFFASDVPEPKVARGYTRNVNVAGEPRILRDNVHVLPVRGAGFGDAKMTARDLLKFGRALQSSKLLDPKWSEWVLAIGRPGAPPPLGAAGGAPGLNAVLASRDGYTVVVMTNFDPPVGEDLGENVILSALTAPNAK